jgi:hypothetical protein
MRGAQCYERPVLRDLALLTVVFGVVTALASLLGAANLGTAASFGQIMFVLALTGLLVRR